MVTKSKLKMALAAEKQTDFGKMHLKKKEKVANKKNKVKAGGVVNGKKGKQVEEEWESVDEEGASGSDAGGVELEEDGSESEGEEGVDAPMQVNSPSKLQTMGASVNQFAD